MGGDKNMTHVKNYLRTHRKQWGLSQEELAALIGTRSGASISRLESLSRHPNLRTAFAVQIIFGVSLEEMFPKVFTQVEDALIRRAYTMYEALQGDSASSTRVKLDLLETILKRANERQK